MWIVNPKGSHVYGLFYSSAERGLSPREECPEHRLLRCSSENEETE